MDWSAFERHIKHLPEAGKKRIREAFDLGKSLHKGQTRKSGEPYFTHPVWIAERLATMGADEESIIVAILHDAVEDTPLTIEEVGETFGPSVRTLIDGLTKLSAQDLVQKPTVNEQVETLRKIFTLMQQDIRIMVIKLIDRLHNMLTIDFLPPHKQQALAIETRDVYVKIADRLSMQDLRDELEGICIRILEPALHEELSTMRANGKARGKAVLDAMQHRMQQMFPQHRVDIRIEETPWHMLRRQHELGASVATGIPSVSMSLVATSVEDCYRTLGILHQLWKREIHSFQDYINSPLLNGYRGVQTTVILEDGMRVGCRILTEEMQQYAHLGVATRCFDSAQKGVLDYLPWTQRISSLAADTKDRSKEFWDSLQNDILGDSIMVHGSDDRTVTLPAGSTALDAAFYLLQDDALRTMSLRINGQQAHFYSTVKHGDSVGVELSEALTVERDWLDEVYTSFAIASIRSALSNLQSEAEKLVFGRQQLQQVMLEGKKGYIEEFNERQLVQNLETIGYSSLDEVYIAIADGHVDPLDAYIAIFDAQRDPNRRKQHVVIRFFLDSVNVGAIEYIQTLQQNRDSFREIRYRYNPAERGGTVILRMFLTAQEQSAVLSELRFHGVAGVHIRQSVSASRRLLGAGSIILLWGLDPVVAHMLLTQMKVSAIDLTIVRFWCFVVLGALGLLWVRRHTNLPQVRLKITSWSLWLSVALLMSVALSTYLSLDSTEPLNYTILMTSAGLLIASLQSRKRLSVIVSWTLLFAGSALLITQSASWPARGVLFTVIAVATFCAFWLMSERYKRQERVSVRSGQHFFLVSLIAAILSLGLIPWSNLSLISLQQLGAMTGFGVFIAGLPYFLTYFWLSRSNIVAASSYSFATIAVTCVAQLFLLQSLTPMQVLASMIVMLGAGSFMLGNRMSQRHLTTPVSPVR